MKQTTQTTYSTTLLTALVGSLLLSACVEQSRAKPAQDAAPKQAATAAAATQKQPGHLRLVNDLDRPQDGYCLDVVGSGDYVRFDMPMTAHNCKPGLYADEAVVMEDNGMIHFPAYGVCATAAGINNTILAGAAVMPKGCGERSPFLEAQHLQHFVHRPDGRVELRGSGLCLTVGNESDSTFDPNHRWRTLFMQHCEQAPLSHSQWRFVVPKSS
ncbi:RICIN domain-containing protein [Neisseria zalophi]|uniref:Uncharacterized protein n=1 Tax=Neisseria zalophi TaxID=640030 RepID=A0A5J6PXB9_9NEIS|nr:RICIN domain-containing protein [Neisseria zalophi]QEY27215.1 hypothetical protein D0T92_09580 [Neisseria zalophi]